MTFNFLQKKLRNTFSDIQCKPICVNSFNAVMQKSNTIEFLFLLNVNIMT